MKKVFLDFSNIKYFRDFHSIIKKSFQQSVKGFPDFCGENLDALWDVLTGFIELPVEVSITGIDKIKDVDLRDYAYKIVKIFEDAGKEEEEGFEGAVKVNLLK